MLLILGRKTVLLIFVHYYWFDQKQLFKLIQNFLRISPFHTWKKLLSEYFSACFWASQFFLLKRKVLNEFLQKCFKTTERHSLAVCGSHWGEKQFLLIVGRFYWFDQKQFFKLIQIFLKIYFLSKMVRKTNFLSLSVLVSELVIFWTKMKSSLWISSKIQKKKKA